MMSFLTLRIWQAYAFEVFEHPQFWQRIDAPESVADAGIKMGQGNGEQVGLVEVSGSRDC